MTTLSYHEFIEYVEEWALANESKIAKLWPQKGGWEGWAQGEIEAYIIGKNSTYDILREQHVYKSSGKSADFLLNDSSTSASDKVVVELKCQSFENYKNFVPGLKSDVSKMVSDLKDSYSGAALVVLGIYFVDKGNIPGYFETKVIGDGEIGLCVAIDLNS